MVIQKGEWRRVVKGEDPGVRERPPSTSQASERVKGLTSIVVIAFNGLDLTRRCVESILRNTGGDYELLLVDNGSTDGTSLYFSSVARGAAHVRAIYRDRNEGVFARTYGMKVARGEFICWLDNDVEVGPGWLEPLLQAMADPRIGGAGVEGVALDGSWQHLYHVIGDPRGLSAPRPVDVLAGYCCLFRNITDFIGFLDPRFSPFWNEDADYSLRVKLLGYRLVVVPVNMIHHRHGTGLRFLGNYKGHIGRMNAALAEKWDSFKHLVLDIYGQRGGSSTVSADGGGMR